MGDRDAEGCSERSGATLRWREMKVTLTYCMHQMFESLLGGYKGSCGNSKLVWFQRVGRLNIRIYVSLNKGGSGKNAKM